MLLRFPKYISESNQSSDNGDFSSLVENMSTGHLCEAFLIGRINYHFPRNATPLEVNKDVSGRIQ